jgi:hypothetical protein
VWAGSWINSQEDIRHLSNSDHFRWAAMWIQTKSGSRVVLDSEYIPNNIVGLNPDRVWPLWWHIKHDHVDGLAVWSFIVQVRQMLWCKFSEQLRV